MAEEKKGPRLFLGISKVPIMNVEGNIFRLQAKLDLGKEAKAREQRDAVSCHTDDDGIPQYQPSLRSTSLNFPGGQKFRILKLREAEGNGRFTIWD